MGRMGGKTRSGLSSETMAALTRPMGGPLLAFQMFQADTMHAFSR